MSFDLSFSAAVRAACGLEAGRLRAALQRVDQCEARQAELVKQNKDAESELDALQHQAPDTANIKRITELRTLSAAIVEHLPRAEKVIEAARGDAYAVLDLAGKNTAALLAPKTQRILDNITEIFAPYFEKREHALDIARNCFYFRRWQQFATGKWCFMPSIPACHQAVAALTALSEGRLPW